jgi:predicted component of type VI protein secretion system
MADERHIFNPAAAYEALRASTAEMFGYPLDALSLTQGLQLDVVSLLRLEVDSLQGKVLAGETVDLQRLVTAHSLLRQMLPERALVAPAPAPDEVDDETARSKFADLVDGYVRARHAEMAADPGRARAEFEAELQEAIAKYPPAAAPAEPDLPERAPWGTPPEPVAATPPPPVAAPPPPPRATSAQPPAHYLREGQPREAWRDHLDAGGNVVVAPFGGGR